MNIPFDMFQSTDELFIILPLGGVKKDSIKVSVKEHKLIINGIREHTKLKETLKPLTEKCFRGEINLVIDLPGNIFYEKIQSKLTETNTLEIIVPKIIIPDQIKVQIQYEK